MEPAAEEFLRCRTHGLSADGIPYHPEERPGKPGGLFRGNQMPALPLFHHHGNPAYTRTHHRQTGGQRAKDGDGKHLCRKLKR